MTSRTPRRPLKHCPNCNRDLPVSKFHSTIHSADHHTRDCKECTNARRKLKPSQKKIIDPETGCWIWQGTVNNSKSGQGYGASFFHGVRMPAHRAVYMELVGDPGDKDLHHRCGNRRCVNPQHLEPLDRKTHVIKTWRPKSYRIADQVDRYSIELIKQTFGAKNDQFLAQIEQDLTVDLGPFLFEFMSMALKIAIKNSCISQSEWQIREGKKLSLEEIGVRALLTRNLNDLRAKIKNDLAVAIGEIRESRIYGHEQFNGHNLTLDIPEQYRKQALAVLGMKEDGTSN